jgi:hypothetical protein
VPEKGGWWVLGGVGDEEAGGERGSGCSCIIEGERGREREGGREGGRDFIRDCGVLFVGGWGGSGMCICGVCITYGMCMYSRCMYSRCMYIWYMYKRSGGSDVVRCIRTDGICMHGICI